MTDRDERVISVGRLEAWIRDYGHEKRPEFIRDLRRVLDAAREALGLRIEDGCDAD